MEMKYNLSTMFNTMVVFLTLITSCVAYTWSYVSHLNAKISSLTDHTVKLNEIIVALDKKCAVVEVAKQAAENTTGLLNTKLKIAEVTGAMQSQGLSSNSSLTYALVGIGLISIIGLGAYFYFGWNVTALLKANALCQATSQSQNAQIMTNSINDTIVKTITAPEGVILTGFSNQEKHLSTVTTLLNNSLTHKIDQLSAKVDILSLSSRNNTGLDTLINSTSSVNMLELGKVGDILGPITAANFY